MGSRGEIWIKICANTSAVDALKAAELGVDAVGFVFAPSRRQVTALQVRTISADLPAGLERIGVFGSVPAENIAQAAETARLTAVQLHAGLDPARTERLSGLMPHLAIIETAHWGQTSEAAGDVTEALSLIAQGRRDQSARVLVDSKVRGSSGGTGIPFHWDAAAPVLQAARGIHVILAGGLNPGNVEDAIVTIQPWGVDVASGVELEPGLKDYAKLEDFVRKARGAADRAALNPGGVPSDAVPRWFGREPVQSDRV